MSKKSFVVKNKKATKLLKCDGQLLKKILIDKGFIPTDLSRMMDYCPDYLNRCIRRNEISDVCAKKLIDYKIFPRMYGVEGDIVTKDDIKAAGGLENLEKDLGIKPEEEELVHYGIKSQKYGEKRYLNPDETQKRAKDILNAHYGSYGTLEKGVKGIDYGYGPAPKNTSYCSYYAAGQDIAKGVFKLMQAAMDDLKRDREFKEMIKQAVKEAFKEL